MSEFSPDRIFISYSRSDGRAFAEAFEQRLEAEAGIKSWSDLKSMEGDDIRPQVLRAIEQVEHFVLVLTRRALESTWVEREWKQARLLGRKVSPVLADRTIKRSELPPWIRRAEIFDIAEPERWRMLVRVLEGPGETRRISFWSGDLPTSFVERRGKYGELKRAVLSALKETEAPRLTENVVTKCRTVGLIGAGGYGKTTLANALCRDKDVRFLFDDGILRIRVGKERDDVASLIVDLIAQLTGRRLGFGDVEAASERLAEVIGEARLLLVIDDVWREAQLRYFLRGGPHCICLVTTRVWQVLQGTSYTQVDVDEMQVDEATSLLSVGLPEAQIGAVQHRLTALAKRLGYWAQMLDITNRWIRSRVGGGEALQAAIGHLEQRLAARGLTGFDPKEKDPKRLEEQRHRAIRACVEASLEDLDASEQARFGELAILSSGQPVLIGVIADLWAETGTLDEDEADDLIEHLKALSLVQSLDRESPEVRTQAVRLHDNMIWYLSDRVGPDGRRAAHAAMVRAIGVACGEAWETLSADHAYGWKHLIRHLRGAARDAEANRLLTDYAWIRAKLHATDAQELFASYLPEPADESVRLVGRSIGLSVPALTRDRRELARQIFGRLGGDYNDDADALATSATEDPDFRPSPRWPSLTAPGMERLRLHQEGGGLSAKFSSDDSHILTVSDDGTARVWDAVSGAEIMCLHGHKDRINDATFSSDSTRILTASDDYTAHVCDAVSGKVIMLLRGHKGRVNSARFSSDDSRILTVSDDGTARVWDAVNGAEIMSRGGHENRVNSATFSSNGTRFLTISDDGMARAWNTVSGEEIVSLRGHEASVIDAVFSTDPTCIVAVYDDGVARVWNAANATEVASLHGYNDQIRNAVFSPDGTRIVTVPNGPTARLWDTASGEEIGSLWSHNDRVNSAAFSPDGKRIVTASNDATAMVWDAISGERIVSLRGHELSVESAAFSHNNTFIVTASSDGTARVWDTVSGEEITSRPGHEDMVRSVAFSPDGTRIITASDDDTLRLWDAVYGHEILSMRAHRIGVTHAAFSPDGTRVAIARRNSTAQVLNAVLSWDAVSESVAEIAFLQGHGASVTSVAFSPDGIRIVTASSDNTARIWEAASGKEIVSLHGHKHWVLSAAFSPDNTRIATASADGTARVWSTISWEEIMTLRRAKGFVVRAAFSPDGTRILTASSDNTARMWDAVTGEEISSQRIHTDELRDAAFSSDGTRIVTASRDNTVRIWNQFGVEVASFRLDAAVTALDVHGDCIACGDALGRVHVFEAGEFLNTNGAARD